jgi:hypothetical protein
MQTLPTPDQMISTDDAELRHSYRCLNCDCRLGVDEKYCNNCGQKTKVHRLSSHDIVHDVVHYFTHADRSIFALLKQLAVKPGIVAKEYLSGKRKKYFNPLNFFLIVAGIVVFSTSWFYNAANSRAERMESVASKMKDAERKAQLLAMAERSRTVDTITGKYSNVINMVATPLLTFIFWLAYKRRFNYIESLVANMYFIGMIMLVYALLIVPAKRMFPEIGFYLLSAFFVFEVIYRGFAYYQLVGKRSTGAILKAYGTSFLITALWTAGTYFLILYYVRNGI